MLAPSPPLSGLYANLLLQSKTRHYKSFEFEKFTKEDATSINTIPILSVKKIYAPFVKDKAHDAKKLRQKKHFGTVQNHVTC
jgi:hypothetical protein